jgi:hypothetical protein
VSREGRAPSLTGQEAGYASRVPVVTQEEEERAREGRGLSPLSRAGLKPAAGL